MTYLNILIAAVVLVILWLIFAYNNLVRLRNRVKEAFSDIDVQLKRRYDLIPNLVEIVKGYAEHEREAFERVTEARAKALNAKTVGEKEEADNLLSSALKSVFAIAEAYPQLRAVEGFVNLQDELSDTENKIQAARRFYNVNVMELNTKIEMFPYNIIANLFKFQKEPFFELEEENAQKPIDIKF